jgi:hypothetical protein
MPCMNADKAKQSRIYIPKDCEKAFEGLAKQLGQSESWLATTVFLAGLKAVMDAGDGLKLPLVLSVAPARPKAKAA